MEAAAYLIPILGFVGLYALLYSRAKRRGQAPTVRWGWLAAILLCAAAAIALGAML